MGSGGNPLGAFDKFGQKIRRLIRLLSVKTHLKNEHKKPQAETCPKRAKSQRLMTCGCVSKEHFMQARLLGAAMLCPLVISRDNLWDSVSRFK